MARDYVQLVTHCGKPSCAASTSNTPSGSWKQTLGWTRPRIRTPDQGERWTWIIVAAHTQLRLARHLTRDLRRPWEKPATEPHRLRPGRPPGSKNRKPARRHDVAKNAAVSTNNVKTG
jgi:hypothetical protein